MSLDHLAWASMNGFMSVEVQTARVAATPPSSAHRPQRGRAGSNIGCNRIQLFLLAGTLLVAGCKHLPAPPTDTGASSVRFVEEPPVPPRKGKMTESSNGPIVEDHFIDAEPIPPLAMPVYPPRALDAKAGLVTIGIRISVDTDGRVSAVAPSMLIFSTPTRYSDEFDEAVEVAVRQWRFHPAQRYTIRIFRTEEGGGPPQELHRENTETYFDLAFTFTASGKVLSGTTIK